jgi:hypothetical protein
MTHADLNDLSPQERDLALALRSRLRASEGLNAVESARLSAARLRAREALATPRSAAMPWFWVALPAAAVAAVAVMMLRPQAVPEMAPPVVNAMAPDALMWMSDEAGPDFYRDLEFYQWLQSRSPTEPNA